MAGKNLCVRTAPEEQDRLDDEWYEKFCSTHPNCIGCSFAESRICCVISTEFTDELYDEMRKILAE